VVVDIMVRCDRSHAWWGYLSKCTSALRSSLFCCLELPRACFSSRRHSPSRTVCHRCNTTLRSCTSIFRTTRFQRPRIYTRTQAPFAMDASPASANRPREGDDNAEHRPVKRPRWVFLWRELQMYHAKPSTATTTTIPSQFLSVQKSRISLFTKVFCVVSLSSSEPPAANDGRKVKRKSFVCRRFKRQCSRPISTGPIMTSLCLRLTRTKL
jgi:hypothetical protein